MGGLMSLPTLDKKRYAHDAGEFAMFFEKPVDREMMNTVVQSKNWSVNLFNGTHHGRVNVAFPGKTSGAMFQSCFEVMDTGLHQKNLRVAYAKGKQQWVVPGYIAKCLRDSFGHERMWFDGTTIRPTCVHLPECCSTIDLVPARCIPVCVDSSTSIITLAASMNVSTDFMESFLVSAHNMLDAARTLTGQLFADGSIVLDPTLGKSRLELCLVGTLEDLFWSIHAAQMIRICQKDGKEAHTAVRTRTFYVAPRAGVRIETIERDDVIVFRATIEFEDDVTALDLAPHYQVGHFEDLLSSDVICMLDNLPCPPIPYLQSACRYPAEERVSAAIIIQDFVSTADIATIPIERILLTPDDMADYARLGKQAHKWLRILAVWVGNAYDWEAGSRRVAVSTIAALLRHPEQKRLLQACTDSKLSIMSAMSAFCELYYVCMTTGTGVRWPTFLNTRDEERRPTEKRIMSLLYVVLGRARRLLFV